MNDLQSSNNAIIDKLNVLLANEILAITQYLANYTHLDFMGFSELAQKFKEEYDDEVKHAKILAKRIRFLRGIPIFTLNLAVKNHTNVRDIFLNDIETEKKGIQDLKETISIADKHRDYGTVEILSQILLDEEEHQLWLEQQVELMKVLDENIYLGEYEKS